MATNRVIAWAFLAACGAAIIATDIIRHRRIIIKPGEIHPAFV